MPSQSSAFDPGFGVYVHWPFCLSKCPYCDFNSHVRDSVDHDRWRRALTAEIDHYADLTPGRLVTSIFFGGGTPSLMEPATVAAIIDRIAARWTLTPGLEITLEANPSSVEQARFAARAAAGRTGWLLRAGARRATRSARGEVLAACTVELAVPASTPPSAAATPAPQSIPTPIPAANGPEINHERTETITTNPSLPAFLPGGFRISRTDRGDRALTTHSERQQLRIAPRCMTGVTYR